MNQNEPVPPLSTFSPITAVIRTIFQFAKWFSFMQWIGCIGKCFPNSWISLFKSRSELTQKEIHSNQFIRNRACAIEAYMGVWILLEFVIVSMSCFGQWNIWLRLLFITLVVSRIIEVIQVTVNATLFDAINGRPDESVASHVRMIVLAGINFIELCICYGTIYALNYTKLHGAGKPITAFYFSIITQLTIGYGDVHPIGWLRIVSVIQGLMGILFVILVFGRFIAALPKVNEIFGKNN